jgi:hypothetical protein
LHLEDTSAGNEIFIRNPANQYDEVVISIVLYFIRCVAATFTTTGFRAQPHRRCTEVATLVILPLQHVAIPAEGTEQPEHASHR